MKQMLHRVVEIAVMAVLVMVNLYSICWGPPGPPPTTPVGNAEMSALTIAGMAAYGFWKMRR